MSKDLEGARAQLFPIVSDRRNTDREAAQLLKLVCQDLKDLRCVAMATAKLAAN